jgi:ABC-type uncharacterized transport system permease subunit
MWRGVGAVVVGIASIIGEVMLVKNSLPKSLDFPASGTK